MVRTALITKVERELVLFDQVKLFIWQIIKSKVEVEYAILLHLLVRKLLVRKDLLLFLLDRVRVIEYHLIRVMTIERKLILQYVEDSAREANQGSLRADEVIVSDNIMMEFKVY